MAASALAPGGEPQKQHLSIIRDFAAEKYHGERTVSCLKGRLDDVVAASDAATAELEAAKRAREAAETELRGSQVQASIAPATIQALEATTSHLQEEIAKVGSDLEELKGCALEQGASDEFISQMLEMNSRIRRFQQIASTELAGRSSELSEDGNQGKATDGHNVSDKNETAESEGMLTDLSDKVSNVVAEMHALEEEYQKDLLVHKKEFDPHTCTWSIVRTYGKPPVSCGGQSVTLVGTTLVVFGGEDAKRGLLNDLHILDLETTTWDVDAIRTPPAPRSDHDAACHAPAA